MGIPRLKRHLEPFAERAAIAQCDAVVDGPALAYHILNLCSRLTRRTSPFEQPSYGLLGETALAWLDRIEEGGLSISAIYFDSYLPRSKRPERLHRAVKSSRDLIKYHSAYLAGVPKGRLRRDGEPEVDLFPNAWPGETHAKPPPPAFLVPAIIDALRNSPKHGPLVKLVPGEADGFCAQHVHGNGGMVLTSDSDLLIHNLGQDGGVVFFTDIEADAAHRLIALQYRPLDICKRLSLKPDTGLPYLAFELSRDSHLTIEQAIAKSKTGDAAADFQTEYRDFVEQYIAPEVASGFGSGQVTNLDPRVSEIALRSFQTPGAIAPRSQNSPAHPIRDDVELEMYLPFLLDCPSRTSAWEASRSTRQLAYAVLQSVRGSRILSVSEMRRLQSVSSGLRVDVPGPSEFDELADSLLARLSKAEVGVSNPEMTWTVLAIYQDIAMTVDRARGYPLGLEVLGQQIRGQLDECSWGLLHFLAQTQATYYSFRMLSQILNFAAHHGGTLSKAMLKLATFLSRLPSLPEFPSPSNFADTLRQVREGGGLPCLASLCEDFEDVLPHIEALQRPQENKKTKKRKATPSTGEGRPKSRFSNTFDLLAKGDDTGE